MSKYFVLYPSEDGCTVTELTESELKKRLNEDYYSGREFLDKTPKDNHNYWGNSILIIKGEIVVPKPIQTVTEYEV